MKHLQLSALLPSVAAAMSFAIVAASNASTTDVTPEQHSKIDAIFAQYTASPRPGCAVGVMKNGHLAHASGYGLADVERRVPITPATLFDIGSTSKQFTAAAVILLELDGKLSLSDDVRKYVPELPDYGAPITIDHLLRHTSGLRDYTELLSLAGVEVEETSGDEQALAIVARQRHLNFPTGSRYEYSNTGYFLASVIVERVSGKSLAEFARERIFTPLGMSHARFRDQYAEIIPDRALGYSTAADAQGAGQFKNALSNWQQTGDGALHLSIEDAIRWDQNFYQPRVGGAALIERLQQPGSLDDGEPIGYARGLFIDEYRGQSRVQHAGNWVGYNAMLARFPQQHVSIAIFCNFEGAEASMLSDQVADVVLADLLDPDASPPAAKAGGTGNKAAKAAARRQFLGSYFAPQTEGIIEIEEDGGALVLKVGPTSLPLQAVGPTSFAAQGLPLTVDFSFAGNGPARQLRMRIGDDETTLATRFDPAMPSAADLQAYTGDFYSEELDVAWPLVIDEGRLALRRETRKFVSSIEPLQPAMKDSFSGDAGFIRFTRDATGRVTGFDLSASRMRGIRFERSRP